MKIVLHALVAIASVVLTFGAWVLVAIAHDQLRDKDVRPISEMLAEAGGGRVEAIDVHGTRYEYRLRGVHGTRVAYGPPTTATELGTLAVGAKVDVR